MYICISTHFENFYTKYWCIFNSGIKIENIYTKSSIIWSIMRVCTLNTYFQNIYNFSGVLAICEQKEVKWVLIKGSWKLK